MEAPQLPALKVTFANARGDAVHRGPFTRLIFDGRELKDGDKQLLATHVAHTWELPNGARYSRFECYVPCSIWFETPTNADKKSRKAGPFSTLSALDGVMNADHRVLAFCDEELNDWYALDFGQHYQCMVVVPYEPPNS
jgi:hypothetical protein